MYKDPSQKPSVAHKNLRFGDACAALAQDESNEMNRMNFRMILSQTVSDLYWWDLGDV